MPKKTFRKLHGALAMAHVRTAGRVRELKSDERAMEVVQVVMLIAVGVIAIVAVWGSLSGFLGNLWGDITNNSQLDPMDALPPPGSN